MLFKALHQQFYPLLLTVNAPFTPVSSFPTRSPFRGCRRLWIHPLLRTVIQFSDVFSPYAFSALHLRFDPLLLTANAPFTGFFHHYPFTL
jgi:hypothetical protein